ncbi:hypothetical protein MIMGU_mgv1a013307mg [Erythranthe guttata]|uniref:Uncharacterized protein n=1 Tax=Erythranthe guttata TaxID=4155 RepID=A0A022RQH3_ERYGU|nr:hypothetical protein MIMGU_mgv1a013307mg [Erythranthe guttata]
MASSMLLRRSIFRNCISARPTVRRISSSSKVECAHVAPWLLIEDSVEDDNKVYNFYSMADKKVIKKKGKSSKSSKDIGMVVGSSHGWLALCNLCNSGGGRSSFKNNNNMYLSSYRPPPKKTAVVPLCLSVRKIGCSTAAPVALTRGLRLAIFSTKKFTWTLCIPRDKSCCSAQTIPTTTSSVGISRTSRIRNGFGRQDATSATSDSPANGSTSYSRSIRNGSSS